MSCYKCNLIVPGFGKSGTSTLHQYLDLHPKICMSYPKETHFFAINNRYQKGPGFHNKIFDDCKKEKLIYYGESSTIHCLWLPALKRIKNDLDNPKIILILRDPIERLLSHYNWLWALKIEERPLLRAVIEEQKRGFHPNISIKGNYPCYLLASNYSYWCPIYLNIFDKNNILFLDSKELFINKEKAMEKCFSFLKIDSINIKKEIHKNKTNEQGLQRKLGLQYISKLVPDLIKTKIDPDRKIRKSVLDILGVKKAKSKPSLNGNDISEISKLLSEDVKFYKELFSK